MNTRSIGTIINSLLQLAVQTTEINISTGTHFNCFARVLVDGRVAKDRDIILKIARRRTESRDVFFAFGDLIEKMVVETANTITPVQRETEIETQSLDHRHTIDGLLAKIASFVQISNEICGLEVDEGSVRMDARTIEG